MNSETRAEYYSRRCDYAGERAIVAACDGRKVALAGWKRAYRLYAALLAHAMGVAGAVEKAVEILEAEAHWQATEGFEDIGHGYRMAALTIKAAHDRGEL